MSDLKGSAAQPLKRELQLLPCYSTVPTVCHSAVAIWLWYYWHQSKFWEPTNPFPGLPTSYSMTFTRLLHSLGIIHLSLQIGSLTKFPHRGQKKGTARTKLPMKCIKALPEGDFKNTLIASKSHNKVWFRWQHLERETIFSFDELKFILQQNRTTHFPPHHHHLQTQEQRMTHWMKYQNFPGFQIEVLNTESFLLQPRTKINPGDGYCLVVL